MQKAPLFNDLAGGPTDGAAWWVTAKDGAQLRLGLWNRSATKGTVLLFPGRTEYIEKYGITASDLAKADLATFTIDWRGQGLSPRLARNPMAGHVERFADYQQDVTAMLRTANALDLPRPFYLLGHSMGGAIGLRALINETRVAAVAFTGPMFGIQMSPFLRAIAGPLSWLAIRFGFAQSIVMNTTKTAYVQNAPFETNQLTNDPAMYQRMIDHLTAQPDLALAGPSYRWLSQALKDLRDLKKRPAPDIPCLTLLGSAEKVVDPDAIKTRMATWPNGHLEIFDQGRHEILMDTPQMRGDATRMIIKHFLTHS